MKILAPVNLKEKMTIKVYIIVLIIILIDKTNCSYLNWMIENSNLKMINNKMMPILVENNFEQQQFDQEVSSDVDHLTNLLIEEDKLKCQLNSDCLSLNKEMYCGKFVNSNF